ncbi:MAG: helix-turn-helix domain-containing protein [Bacteroidales bacterium]|jgi:DNA-binding XRE family transcriptional regulator|nr:helix-turn-helix domain-containing protein [Bacteroidales bacterium]
MKYSELIKELRNKLLLTQTEFAALVGVSYETVNRWENEKNEPSMKIKRKIVAIIKENQIGIEAK